MPKPDVDASMDYDGDQGMEPPSAGDGGRESETETILAADYEDRLIKMDEKTMLSIKSIMDTRVKLSVKMDDSIEILDDSIEILDLPSVYRTMLTFRQVGGPMVQVNLAPGWRDDLEGKAWLNDDMICALCSRLAQAIPYERLRVLDANYYTTIIEHDRVGDWLASRPRPLTCLPVCVSAHWILIVIVSLQSATIFHMDSLSDGGIGRKVAETISIFISKTGTTTNVAEIKVPAQCNGHDCGVHVVSNFETVVKIMDQVQDDQLVDALKSETFKWVGSREDFLKDLDDAFQDSGRRWVYWAQYMCGTNDQFWWPCRVISRRLAGRIRRRPKQAGYVPVIWFKKGVSDAIWIKNVRHPLSKWTADEVINMCSFSSGEVALLHEAYGQAIQF